MSRYYYTNSICAFCTEDQNSILGYLVKQHEFSLEEQQKNAWKYQITYLQEWLEGVDGYIIFEYKIPRMGKRVDCVIISNGLIFALEFKIGASKFEKHAINQVLNYALDLKNFHEQCHERLIIPILICTTAKDEATELSSHDYDDGVAEVLKTNGKTLGSIINTITKKIQAEPINSIAWIESKYKPTPTIIEAAQRLYKTHNIEEISRSDSGAINLSKTSNAISEIINYSKKNHQKSICLITGVPGAGKTLAGLNLANAWHNNVSGEHAVFLSGNGPLVDVLQEALARYDLEYEREIGNKITKSQSIKKSKAFIQNIHHFRDDGLAMKGPPTEHVVIFDEAQRAWSQKHTASFMKRKKGLDNFNQSEPEFLISLMDRHEDWATIVCLIGGGQEINTGEAGIHEWFSSLERAFPHWSIYVSSKITDHEYTRGLNPLSSQICCRVNYNDDLHLAVSIRSYRTEKVASFVKALLDCNSGNARDMLEEIERVFPIVITRNLTTAKNWLRKRARGTERYGIVASSGAMRLKPSGINVKNPIDPKNWFLNDESDIRSSYFMEDVATEFAVQGLELDWTCIAWDGDFRYANSKWDYKSFRGTSWQSINDTDSKLHLKNTYRVLLTRARKGMVIFIPPGDEADQTRLPTFYDPTYEYLISLGIRSLDT